VILASFEARDPKSKRLREGGGKWCGRMQVQSRGVQEFGLWGFFITRRLCEFPLASVDCIWPV
jgi:hypothetical protein